MSIFTLLVLLLLNFYCPVCLLSVINHFDLDHLFFETRNEKPGQIEFFFYWKIFGDGIKASIEMGPDN